MQHMCAYTHIYIYMAVDQNQWYHSRVGAPLTLVSSGGDWDVDWGCDLAFDPWPYIYIYMLYRSRRFWAQATFFFFLRRSNAQKFFSLGFSFFVLVTLASYTASLASMLLARASERHRGESLVFVCFKLGTSVFFFWCPFESVKEGAPSKKDCWV